MITIVSTPQYDDPDNPVVCRWLATESANNFRLLRRDFDVVASDSDGGFLRVRLSESYTGLVSNVITIYDSATASMKVGTVTDINTHTAANDYLTTDIPYVAGTAGVYLNDLTLRGGYYFEGRLTINDVLHPLTIIASPDTFGYADLDVSGILRIATSLGKTGDYTETIMAEPTKSGKFNFEFRDAWYGSDNAWEGVVVTSPETSPPILIDWYYAESVRSEEQGSNLFEYVADEYNDAPFFNQFERPVYFLGLPFDLSFILPEQAEVSPGTDITVTLRYYSPVNILLMTDVQHIPADDLQGKVCSLNINPATVPTGATYLTAEIEV
jgi:hypothetical protein